VDRRHRDLVPPASLRDRVYAFARTQRTPDPALDTYLSLSADARRE
jgi:hypothetical protein